MQPSKEREASERDPVEGLDELLDDDRTGDEGDPAASSAGERPQATETEVGRIGLDGRWVSGKALALALVAVTVGAVAGSLIPVIGGTVGTAAGVFSAAFLLGLVSSARRYAEVGTAGAAAGVVTAVTSVLGVGFLPIGIDYLQQWGLPLLAVGGGLGLGAALLGHYFGRDLRSGLSRDVDG